MRPARILMLLENNPYSQDVRVKNEARALTEAGYRVFVISPRAQGEAWVESVQGVRVYHYPAPPDGSGLLGFALEFGYSLVAIGLVSLWVLVREGFDIVHAHCPPDAFGLLGAFYKLLGKRFVVDHHDLSPEVYTAKFGPRARRPVLRLLIALERLALRLADRVLATNQSYKAMEVSRGGVSETRIHIVRNGPDLARVRLVPPDPKLRGRAKHLIGYVGIMGRQDGVDYLLRALKHLRDDLGRHDFFAVLIGRGEAWEWLRAEASRLGLDDRVWFTGRIPEAEKWTYLSTVDICAVPDPSNPFNDRSTMIKLMEYLALGKPAVAFDLPEHRVTAGDAALYAHPNDELAFARQLARLMDDTDLRHTMGAIGRERVETRLAWEHSVPHLLDAYARLVPDPDGQRRPVRT